MTYRFDSGALLASFYDLPRGPRVCLRLARQGDRPGIATLLRGHGHELEEIELARLVASDPRRTVVITATGLVDGRHQVLGFGVMTVAGNTAEPALLVVDDQQTDGLDELLREALSFRALTLAHRHAA